jgi:hypothetical protein
MVCSFGLVAKWLQGQYYYAGMGCPKFIAGVIIVIIIIVASSSFHSSPL